MTPQEITARDLVLCRSADGWSLHAPGSTDEQIANGDAPYLVSGDNFRARDEDGEWIRPDDYDYDQALEALGVKPSRKQRPAHDPE
jgi:hypothetical protein